MFLIGLSPFFTRAQNTFPSSGKVGIGTSSPQTSLDINGSLVLRDYSNLLHHGSTIEFTSYADTSFPGPKIRSSLLFAQGSNSMSQLILSSYNGFNGGYKNEITIWNGMVGIGTATPQEALSVNGNIRSKQVKVEVANWPDFVFKKEYKLPPLKAIDKFVAKFHHLPKVPDKDEVLKDGLNLGEMNRILLQKVEELTLYAIEKEKAEGLLNIKISSLTRSMDGQAKLILLQELRLAKIERAIHSAK